MGEVWKSTPVIILTFRRYKLEAAMNLRAAWSTHSKLKAIQ